MRPEPDGDPRRVEALAKAALAQVDKAAAEVAAMPAGTHDMLPLFAEAIRKRCNTVLSNLADTPAA